MNPILNEDTLNDFIRNAVYLATHPNAVGFCFGVLTDDEDGGEIRHIIYGMENDKLAELVEHMQDLYVVEDRFLEDE